MSSLYTDVHCCQGVTVDVCKILRGEDSVFLQQACHLTKGIYFRLDDVEGLLQTLMVGCGCFSICRNDNNLTQITFARPRSLLRHPYVTSCDSRLTTTSISVLPVSAMGTW